MTEVIFKHPILRILIKLRQTGRLYDKNGVYFADGASGLWTNK